MDAGNIGENPNDANLNGNYFNWGMEKLADFCSGAKDYRNNATLFHKTGLVALGALKILMSLNPKFSYLFKFEKSLDSTNLFYPFAVLSIPYKLFCRVNADTIDDNELAKRLALQVARHTQDLYNEIEGIEAAHDNVFLSASQDITTKIVRAKLGQMAANNDGFRNRDTFKAALRNQFQPIIRKVGDALQEEPRTVTINGQNIDLRNINLNALDVPLKSTSWIEKGIDLNWALVDIASVLFYLRTFKLLDTGKLAAATIGKIHLVSWVKDHHLMSWLSGGCTAGYLATCILKRYQLMFDQNLTEKEKKTLRADAFNAGIEIINNGAFFLNEIKVIQVGDIALNSAMVVAKLIGIAVEWKKPPREFVTAIDE